MEPRVKRKKAGWIYLLVMLSLFFRGPNLYADDNSNFAFIGRGFSKILTAAFQVPRYLIGKTLTEPIGLGTIDGALQGVFYAVSSVLDGTLDIGRGVVPYAKYALPFLFL